MWSIIGYCGLIVLEAVAVSATMSSQMESSWSASFILINVLGLAPTANGLANRLYASRTAERDW